jgi:hypothetical protein
VRVSLPSPLGMCTRRTGGATYVPDFARSISDWRLDSKFAAYSAAVTPSTPTAPSLRVHRHASSIQSMSMKCERLLNAICGAALAIFAIQWHFVETVMDLGVSAIFPSIGSVTPLAPSLHRIPRSGSPASTVLWAAPNSFRPFCRTSFPSFGNTSFLRSRFRSGKNESARSFRPGYLLNSAPTDYFRLGDRMDLPSSWRNPCIGVPRSSTPVGLGSPVNPGVPSSAFRAS